MSEESNQAVLDSPPVLQNPATHGVTVVWAVKQLAVGWVEYGDSPQLGQRADAAVMGQHLVSERFMRVRIEGIEVGKPLFYRVAAAPVEFGAGSQVDCGEPEYGEIYCWTPLDETAQHTSFAVINDTHSREEALVPLLQQLIAAPADVTIWNGDVFNAVESEEDMVAQVLRPGSVTYAAEHPVLFTSGNHDYRGRYSRLLHQVVSSWEDEVSTGRNFAVRLGPLAMIGLDTTEDKPDRHPIFAGLTCHERYREEQRAWLQQILRRPEIASAPYLIAFCHIPLWGLEGHNPGDTLEGYAYYCRHAQQLWHPLLEAAGVQLLISGHMHHFRYDAPTAEHSYGQIVGGGPFVEGEKRATLIRGHADKDKMELIVSDVHGAEMGRWDFAPRS